MLNNHTRDRLDHHEAVFPLIGEPITAKLTRAPRNGALIGGLKVSRAAAGSRPDHPGPRTYTSFTQRAPKNAESSKDQTLLDAVLREAQQILSHMLAS